MKAETEQTLIIVVSSIYGALIGLAANLLYSDLQNWASWFMFIVVMIINFLILNAVIKHIKRKEKRR